MFAKLDHHVLLHRLTNDAKLAILVLAERRYEDVLIVTTQVVEEDGYLALQTLEQVAFGMRRAAICSADVIVIANFLQTLLIVTELTIADVTFPRTSEIHLIRCSHADLLGAEEEVRTHRFILDKLLEQPAGRILTRVRFVGQIVEDARHAHGLRA